jgi:hypothetical protein
MTSKLNKSSYEQLIAENVEWLLGCTSRTLERDHIIAVLQNSIALHYPSQPSQPASDPCECKPFCESHGRDEIAAGRDGEFCNECAADGFGGELCHPSSSQCDMTNPKSNEWERSFMCAKHAAEHVIFCATHAKSRSSPIEGRAQGMAEEINGLVDILDEIYTQYDGGTECYEYDDGEQGAYVGVAIKISPESENRIIALLNKERPRHSR